MIGTEDQYDIEKKLHTVYACYIAAAIATATLAGYAGKKKDLGKLFKYGTVLGISVVSPCVDVSVFGVGLSQPIEHIAETPIGSLIHAFVLLGAYKAGERLAGK